MTRFQAYVRLALGVVVLIAAIAVNNASAQSRIRLTAKNRKRVTIYSDLAAPPKNLACYRKSRAVGVLGTVRGSYFIPRGRAALVRRALRSRRLKASRSKISRSVNAALRRCRKKPAEQPPAPVPTATPRPQGPGASPSPTPTQAPRPNQPTATPTPGVPYTPPPLPMLAEWESQMASYGQYHCNRLRNGSMGFDPSLAATYYDAQWVFYQIGDYTGNSAWYDCARAAEAVYRDQYVLPNNGQVPGYWNFPHGVTEDYLRTGDAASRTAAILLSQNAAYAPDSTPLAWTVDASMSREVAYTIMSYLNAELLGQPHRARTEQFVAQALGHLDQWFVSRTAEYVRPFMFALTAHALISYDRQIGNPAIRPAIEQGANWIWQNTWLPNQGAFKYTDRNHSSGGTEPAPDLNLLIAPVYAWLWHETGNSVYRDRADQIFAGGVRNAWLQNGKQFNQNYRWSFEMLRWRNQAPRR